MNKKGITFKYLIEGILVIIVILFVILAIYQGIWKQTEDVAGKKLPNVEVFKNKIKEIMTSEGEVELDTQERIANEIFSVIKNAINNMENDKDCIEEMDFSGIPDDYFIVEFKPKNGGTELIYEKDYIFSDDLKGPLYYFMEGKGPSKNFVVDNLDKISFENRWFLHKNKAELIGFSEKNTFEKYFKNKQICSTGEYLKMIPWQDLYEYSSVIISESRHTKDKEKLDGKDLTWFRKEKHLGTFDRGNDGYWRSGDLTPVLDKPMASRIKNAMELKFRIQLI